MKNLSYLLLSTLFFLSPLLAEDSNSSEPIFGGTILATYPQNTESGHFSIQPYMYCTRINGTYTKNWGHENNQNIHQYIFTVLFQTGLTDLLDISITPEFVYSRANGFDTFLYGDTEIAFGMQLLKEDKKSWTPDLRFLLEEIFPTGVYQNLDPRFEGIDASGTGAFQTAFILAARKIFGRDSKHPYNFNLNFLYIFSSDVEVNGFNVYGGDETTFGKVKPGSQFITNLAFEINITKQFTMGTDLNYLHTNESRFWPKNTGTLAGVPSYEEVSLAPCLEYNFNENIGLIGGIWFSVAGRNSSSFISAATSFYYYY